VSVKESVTEFQKPKGSRNAVMLGRRKNELLNHSTKIVDLRCFGKCIYCVYLHKFFHLIIKARRLHKYSEEICSVDDNTSFLFRVEIAFEEFFRVTKCLGTFPDG
jgi:hypothetical protein